ncbi:porin [Ramlibacter sp. WS9]|uniref:porin n=1 Tax=Ramlibacter sp. WS9 TaxID=1882741 RepID=UPI0011451560|nr:porin [Ramlibacter sp. WS9]ROZ75027.1 porin [Ramlibacter sp. WS9]
MKKSLIAMAALAAACTASAQSTVTLFGVVDATLKVGHGSASNKTQLGSSGLTSSRLGFRGTEDLGGGMSASFWLEGDLNADNGEGAATNTNNQASGTGAAVAGRQGLTFNRRSTVSLAGGWGELRLGRDYTPQFWNLTIFDPFFTLGVGSTQTIGSIITGATAARASNSIGYLLPPNLGGFYGQVQAYLGENNTGPVTQDDGKGAAVRVGLESGPFNVAVAVSRTEYATGNVRQNNVAGQWTFGFGKVMGQITRDRAGAVDGKGWLLGGVFPVGSGDIRASYSAYESTAVGTPETKKLALGYVHNLSKRTAVYATWARVKNGGSAVVALNGSTTGVNASSSGLDIGLRHSF